ncbi:MAG: tetratricopeptide repeat protein [Planctomycetota bacterium]
MNEWSEAEKRVERAHELYEAGRWDEAEHELREALTLNPYKAEWHFNLGLTLEAAGRHADAMEAFEGAHRLDPADTQALLAMALNALRADRPGRALAWLDEAIGVDSRLVEAYIHRIEAFTRLGRHDEAELSFYEALQLEDDPQQSAQAYANMGEALMERSEHERAIYCFREAASLDPTLPRINGRLAQVCAATGRHDRARKLFVSELRDNPGDPDTLLDFGDLLVDMHRYAEAGEKYRRVLELDPNHTDAHFALADLSRRQHRHEQALAGYALVLKLDHLHPEASRRIASLLLARGELARAIDHLRAELSRLRDRPRDFIDDDVRELGDLLLEAKLPRQAVRVFRVLVDRRAGDADAWHALAVAQFESGRRAEGLESADRALSIRPDHVPALHNTAMALAEDRDWNGATSCVKKALAIDPDDTLLRRLAMTIRVKRVIDAALAPFRRSGG